MTPILAIDNILNNVGFGISITYEAPSLFELGNIVIKCGPSNGLTLYDSLKNGNDPAKLVVLKKETKDIQNKKKITKEETRAIRKDIYNLYLAYGRKQ